MYGPLKILGLKHQTSEDGNMEIVITIDKDHKTFAAGVLKQIKQLMGKASKLMTITFDWEKKKRTVGQNALMWGLLTELALHINEDTKDDWVKPEDWYYTLLDRYGVATFVTAPSESEGILKKFCKAVKKIDDCMIVKDDGVLEEAATFKMMYGSSKYNTKQMTALIDGLIYEMCRYGVSMEIINRIKGNYEEYYAG